MTIPRDQIHMTNKFLRHQKRHRIRQKEQIQISNNNLKDSDLQNVVSKARLQDVTKKLIKVKKGRVRSPAKKPKIRVNVPKEKVKSNILIQESLNNSVIDESVMSEKLMISNGSRKGSRTYLVTHGKPSIANTSDAIHIHDGYKKRNKVFSNKYLQNAFHFNDYKDREHGLGKGPRPVYAIEQKFSFRPNLRCQTKLENSDLIEGEFSAGTSDLSFTYNRKKYLIENQNSALTPLVNHSVEEPK